LHGSGYIAIGVCPDGVKEVAERVKNATRDDEEVGYEEVGFWWVESEICGLWYQVVKLICFCDIERHVGGVVPEVVKVVNLCVGFQAAAVRYRQVM
jgi:hypothetical protein